MAGMENTKSISHLEASNLRSLFHGTARYYRYLCGCALTEGTKYVADNGAAWAMDVIASYQTRDFPALERLQVWDFKKQADSKCLVYMGYEVDENGEDIFNLIQTVPYTDLSVDSLRIYCQGRVIFLPSEY